ncbi:hypothetical protein AVEN_26964-1 [Araneus ventricosus]|uniref:Uncharacterized protein n=1 Tax=Araneus ventricosus TaxID=182803 RepID=A0A4Y2SBU4_ARAVE|nr:hypothetical protein AVEN_26964-1 [Araneus ventricosus]
MKGLGEDKLNVSTYKAKMKKPFTFPVKNYFPNFKISPDKNKVVSTEKSKLSTAKSKEETKLFDYPIKNYSPNLEKIAAKSKTKGLGKGENEAKTSSVGDENNPEDIRILVESFRQKLSLFVEKEQEKLPNLTSKTHWLDLESNVLQKWIDSCLENSEIASTEEEEEDIEPEMYISYNKKDFNKTFFCHPSLFVPFCGSGQNIQINFANNVDLRRNHLGIHSDRLRQGEGDPWLFLHSRSDCKDEHLPESEECLWRHPQIPRSRSSTAFAVANIQLFESDIPPNHYRRHSINTPGPIFV